MRCRRLGRVERGEHASSSPLLGSGPLIGVSLMARFGIDGVFYLMAAAIFLLALVAGFGSLVTQSPMHLKHLSGS